MNINRVIRIFLLAMLTGAPCVRATAQDSALHVIDFVDLSREVAPYDPDMDPEHTWSIKFRESWLISPEKSSILKSVVGYEPNILNAPPISADSLQKKFASLIRQLPQVRGTFRLSNISYEFMLLDPHIIESGNIAFPEPVSMDPWTKKLQEELIALIKSRSVESNRYELNGQLLSVHFHEEWTIDPVSLQITKKVEGITPVIWQRRQTTTSEPVNDADTGLPVYYKNSLPRIGLRNP